MRSEEDKRVVDRLFDMLRRWDSSGSGVEHIKRTIFDLTAKSHLFGYSIEARVGPSWKPYLSRLGLEFYQYDIGDPYIRFYDGMNGVQVMENMMSIMKEWGCE